MLAAACRTTAAACTAGSRRRQCWPAAAVRSRLRTARRAPLPHAASLPAGQPPPEAQAPPARSPSPTEQLLDLANPSSCQELFLGNLPTLLAAGADLEASEEPETARRPRGTTRSHGGTALHITANNGWPKAVAALLQAGADAQALDSQRRTPLHAAAAAPALWLPGEHTAAGKEEAAQLLLAAGADPNTRDGTGAVPLLLALRYLTAHEERLRDELCGVGAGYCPALGRLLNSLVAVGADLDVADGSGTTPRQLLVAYLKGHVGDRLIDALLQAPQQ